MDFHLAPHTAPNLVHRENSRGGWNPTPHFNAICRKFLRNKNTDRLVTAKTVNLAQIASVFAGKAKQDSNYKKLQRFFRFFELALAEIANLVASLSGKKILI